LGSIIPSPGGRPGFRPAFFVRRRESFGHKASEGKSIVTV